MRHRAGPGTVGARSFGEAMGRYQAARDEHVLPMYEFTTQLATLEPPPEELRHLLAAVHGNQEAMDGFARTNAGVTSPADFFSERKHRTRLRRIPRCCRALRNVRSVTQSSRTRGHPDASAARESHADRDTKARYPSSQKGTAMELIIMLLAPFPIGYFIRNRTAAAIRPSSRTRLRRTGPAAWSTCSSSPQASA